MKRIFSIVIVMMMLMGGMSTLIVATTDTGLSVSSETPINPMATHVPIRIDSDADFTAANGVVSGSGTLADPYMIENWTIDGSGYGYGIYVGNTTAYFVINNCTVENADGVGTTPYFSNAGIILQNVRNALVMDSIVSFCSGAGIYLGDSESSRIFNTTVYYNGGDGLMIESSRDTQVYLLNASHSTASNCAGIHLVGSQNVKIERLLTYSNNFGLYLDSSQNITLNATEVRLNYNNLLYITHSSNITISNTELNAEGDRRTIINLQYSSHIHIINTSAGNSSTYLFYAQYTDNITVEESEIYSTTFTSWAVNIQYCDDFSIQNSILHSTINGLYLYLSKRPWIFNNTFYGIEKTAVSLGTNDNTQTLMERNTIYDSIVGIYVYCTGLILRNNTMHHTGIFMYRWDSADVIENNTVNGKPVFYTYNQQNFYVPAGVGEVLLYSCRYFTIDGVNVSDGTVGIQIYASSYGTIKNSTIINNHAHGLHIVSGTYLSIENNTIGNSTEYTLASSSIYMQYASYNDISNNTIYGSNAGIYFYTGNRGNTLRDNVFLNNGIYFDYTRDQSDNDIDRSNMVNGKPVYFLAEMDGYTVPDGAAGQVIVMRSTNISVGSQDIHSSSTGVEVIYSTNVSISGTHIRDERMSMVYVSYSSGVTLNGVAAEVGMDRLLRIFRSDNISVENSTFRSGTGLEGIYVSNSENISISGTDIHTTNHALYVALTDNVSIRECSIYTNASGIYLSGNALVHRNIEVLNNTIRSGNGLVDTSWNGGITTYYTNGTLIAGNEIYGFYYGLYIYSSSALRIYENDLASNRMGLYIFRSTTYSNYLPSMIYHNNFIDSIWGSYYVRGPYGDIFNLSYPEGGNYYSDYGGVDYFSGPNQDILGPDGIGDTSYTYSYGGTVVVEDHYPLIFPYGSIPTELANSSWPMLNHDAMHSGMTDVNGPPLPVEYWNFSTGDSVFSSPAIASDGSIYFGSMDGHLYALNSDGSLKWTFSTGSNISSSPAIAQDGSIYFGALDGKLYALYPNGTEKWNYSASNGITASPAIGTDGTIYFSDTGGTVYAVRPDGTGRWSSPSGANPTSPAIGTDGTVYVSTYSSGTYAFYPNNGTLRWRYTGQPGNTVAPPAVMYHPGLGRDLIILGSDTGNLTALLYNGTYMGGFDADSAVNSSVSVASDGTIYAGSENGTVYALYEGNLLWSFNTSGPIEGSIAIDSAGNLYFASGQTIYALDSSGNQIWNHSTPTKFRSYPAIAEGLLFIGGDSGLYCFGDVSPPTISITSPSEGALTGETNITVTWTGSDFGSGIEHYEVRIDGGTWTDVGTNTQHTFTGLSDGQHTVSVMAVDNAGNSAEDSVNFSVDTYPPSVNISYPVSGAIINTADIVISWDASDNGSGIGHYELKMDDSSWIDLGENTTYSITGLSEGEHTVLVRAFDRTGKNSTANSTFTVDTVAPELFINDPYTGQIFGTDTVTVVWIATDETSGVQTFHVRIDGGEWMDVGTNNTHIFSNLSSDTHTVQVRATDRAGNEATAEVDFITDTEEPVLQITAPEQGSLHNGTVSVKWSSYDNVSGIAHFEVRLDEGEWVDVGNSTEQVFRSLSNGEHTVYVRAYDRAGNSVSESVIFTVDASAPFVVSNFPAEGMVVSVDEHIVVEFSEDVVHSSVHISLLAGNSSVQGSITWDNNTLTFTPYSDLSYATQYLVRVSGARDLAGNVMEEFAWTFTTTNIGTVSGQVLDENGNPVVGATVTADTGQSTTTDANGSFSLDLPMGLRKLTVSGDGYEEVSVNVTVVPGETTELPPVELPESQGLFEGSSSSFLYILLGILLLAAVIGALLFMKRRGGDGGETVDEEEYAAAEELYVEEEPQSFEELESAPAEAELPDDETAL